MIIGIDIDGVILDTEETFRTYEEIYDVDILKGNNLIDREEPKYQSRYNWSKDEENAFKDKYFMQISRETNLMSGFLAVYNRLRQQGHTFIVITARGGMVKEMKDDALRIFEEYNIEFDKYYWAVSDKLSVCKKEAVDIMIDDDWKIVKNLSENNVNTLYFRDTNLKKLKNNEFLTEVNNWGDIYRYISSKCN